MDGVCVADAVHEPYTSGDQHSVSERRASLLARVPVFGAFSLLVLLLAIGKHHFGNIQRAWKMLGIPALEQTFADTRTITHSINCLLSGRNPYFDRSFDPWHRLYNYPPIWLDLRYLGIRASSTNWIGMALVLGGAAACALLFRARRWTSGVIIFAALLCWPFLFAIERGNTDLAIFAFLIFGLLAIERTGKRSWALRQGSLIVVLTVLKVYPVATVVAMVRNRRAIVAAACTAALAVAALVITCGHDLRLVLGNTPWMTVYSFGSYPFLHQIGTLSGGRLDALMDEHGALPSLFALVLGLLMFAAGAKRRTGLTAILPEIDLETARGCICLSGLAIYCLAFVLGCSFDYRLVFLFCPLMYLIEDLNRGTSHRSLLPALVILAFLWSPYLGETLVGELLDGIVYATGCVWIGATLTCNFHKALTLGQAQ